jgi:thiol-disulfide isomerase/thioredoxin
MADATDAQGQLKSRPVRFWITLSLLAAGLFVYVVLVTTPTPAPSGTEGPAIGRRLASLRLQALSGEARGVSLDDLQDRVTLINFWGTWCPPCLREFPEIVELGLRFAPREDFRLYAVSCGERDDPTLDGLREQTADFLQSRQITMPIYADQNADTRRAMMLTLGLDDLVYPTTLVLDRQGVIRGFWQGYHHGAASEMSELVERLLAEPTKS